MQTILILKKGEKTKSTKLEYKPNAIYVDFDEEKVTLTHKSEPTDTSYILANWIPAETYKTIIDSSVIDSSVCCDKKVNTDGFSVIESFIDEQKQMPSEFQQLIQDNFWDLVD